MEKTNTPALKSCPQRRGVCTRVYTTTRRNPIRRLRKVARVRLTNQMEVDGLYSGRGAQPPGALDCPYQRRASRLAGCPVPHHSWGHGRPRAFLIAPVDAPSTAPNAEESPRRVDARREGNIKCLGEKPQKDGERQPDSKFGDMVLSQFIGNLMKRGKRSTAESILYSALNICERKPDRPGWTFSHKALNNVKPVLEVKSRRVGGATYQVRLRCGPAAGRALAIRWVIQYAHRGPKRPWLKSLLPN